MKKRIFLIVNRLTGGGAERVVGNLSKILSKLYDVFIISLYKEEISYDYRGKLLELELPKLKGIELLHGIYLLRDLKKKLIPDISISFLEQANLLNILTKSKEKVILSIRDAKTDLFFQKEKKTSVKNFFRRIAMKTYKLSDAVVVPSERMKGIFSNFLGNVNLEKIENFYDFEEIEKKAGDFENFNFGKYILYVGRLHKLKKVDQLIKAFHSLIKIDKFSDLKLFLIGKGEEEKSLKELVKQLNLKNSVKFLGFLKNPYPFIKKARLLVLPSIREGFPNVIVEAITLKTPVVARNCFTGPDEIMFDSVLDVKDFIVGNCGVLYENSDSVELLKKSLEFALDNVEKFNIENCFEKIKKKYDATAIIEKWIDLLEG